MNTNEKLEKLLKHMLYEVEKELGQKNGKVRSGKFKREEELRNTKGRLGKFEKPYLYSNERLSEMFDAMDLEGASVLTVGSSGDQILYSIFSGAKKVTCFDINPFTKEFFELKKSAIQNLSFKDFYEFVLEDENFYSPFYYMKLRCGLSDEVKNFWDNAYLEGFNASFNIIKRDSGCSLWQSYVNSPEVFDKLKERLNDSENPTEINFINCNLKNISNLLKPNEQFDLILLSNVVDYLYDWRAKDKTLDPKLKFRDTVLDLKDNHLSDGGKIQVGYAWNKVCLESSRNFLESIFEDEDIKYLIRYEKTGRFDYNENALVLEK